MREAFVRRLVSLAEEDDRVFLVTGDLGFGVLTDYWLRFPAQFLNAGVAEQNMTGLATGLALEGRIVFTYSIANFPTLRCLEQIRNDAAYHEANVKVVGVGGGLSYGALGMSHHATEDLAVLRALPNVTVVAPGTLWEAEEATQAVARRTGTCYLRLDKSYGSESEEFRPSFEIGRARRLREGSDVTIVATGGILGEALAAAEQLGGDRISCRVVSMHTVKPLDVEEVRAACLETGALVTLEEHGVDAGVGSAVAEACMDMGMWPQRAARMGLRAGFSSVVGSQQYLRTRYDLDRGAIVRTVRGLLRGPANRQRGVP